MTNSRPLLLLLSVFLIAGCATKQPSKAQPTNNTKPKVVENSVATTPSEKPQQASQIQKQDPVETKAKPVSKPVAVEPAKPKTPTPGGKPTEQTKPVSAKLQRKIEAALVKPKPKVQSKPKLVTKPVKVTNSKPSVVAKPKIPAKPKVKVETKPIIKEAPVVKEPVKLPEPVVRPVVTLDALPIQYKDWTISEPAPGKTNCSLRSQKSKIKDNAGGTPIYLDINDALTIIKTKSDVDLSYPNSALTVNEITFKFDKIQKETNVTIEQRHSEFLASLKKAETVTVELGFWPSWPQTQSFQTTIPVKGFKVAFEAWNECNKIQ